MSRTERLVFGVFLVMLGSFLTLGNLGILDSLGALRRAWPALFVLWGALILARGGMKEAR
jgi:hypothetical protein